VHFAGPTEIAGRRFTHAAVERDFKTASSARLLRFQPGDVRFVFKLGDVSQEAAVMCCLHAMNERWRRSRVSACGVPVQAVTYKVIALGTEGGLMEAVVDSWTLRELANGCTPEERHLRVLRALRSDMVRLDMLAASTVAYLTAGYALGIRDSHDDNIMLRGDGSLFRVDFGYIFGAAPNLDAPPNKIPRAVAVALGPSRWREVVAVSELALVALSGDLSREPPAWDCVRSVPEMAVVHNSALAHARLLSLDAFREYVQNAQEWSLARAAKNRIREAVRYITDPNSAAVAAAMPFGPPVSGGAGATWKLPWPGGDVAVAPPSDDIDDDDADCGKSPCGPRLHHVQQWRQHAAWPPTAHGPRVSSLPGGPPAVRLPDSPVRCESESPIRCAIIGGPPAVLLPDSPVRCEGESPIRCAIIGGASTASTCSFSETSDRSGTCIMQL